MPVGWPFAKSLLRRNKQAVFNLMLGVKFNNRESVHGPMKVVLTPNIGLDVLQ